MSQRPSSRADSSKPRQRSPPVVAEPDLPFPFANVDDQGRPYVQPTHGLGARSGKALQGGATYENLGGRMLLRHEHCEHMKRLRKVKPGIDSSAPKSYVERKRQQRLYLSRFGIADQSQAYPGAAQNTSGGAADGGGGAGSVQRSSGSGSVGRLRSAVGGGGGSGGFRSSTPTRGGGASATPHRGGGGGSSPSRRHGGDRGDSSSAYGGGANSSLIHERNVPARDVFSALTPDAQGVCKQTIQVLEGLSTADARTLLTQLLREAEEKRLLQAYSGVFPAMTTDASHYEQQHQQQQRGGGASSNASQQQQQQYHQRSGSSVSSTEEL